MCKVLSIIVALLVGISAYGQQLNIPLWGDKVPNSTGHVSADVIDDSQDIIKLRHVQYPSMDVFFPSERMRTGQAVVICPGGGYTMISYDSEGTDVAKWFNSKGVVAIVLKYRLPMSESNEVSYKSPLMDAQRAIRLARHNAQDWGVDPSKVGVVGFSAGGHLAASLSTLYSTIYAEAVDNIDELSARPDFTILGYPVVTFKDDYTDNGTRNKLTRFNPTPELIEKFSCELHVDANTPPAFLVHSSNDSIVPVQNSLQYFQRLIESGVESEMHIYPIGGHGYSLAHGNEYLSTWTERLESWLRRH
ncbi:MAG: alpha/beta hydrolase [Rikenellaceae bacterium]